MSIGILYERSETDEMGIKLTARELGINLAYIPFRKVAVCLDKNGYSFRSKGKTYSKVIEDVHVILNRGQSKNRRLFAANILEALGKYVINPPRVEFICYSKLRTILHFWKEGIKTPRTVYVPCDSHEPTMDGSEIHNEEEIADLIEQELGNRDIVIKPDAGTHGKKVKLAKAREDLLTILGETEPSIINPVGILAQKLVQKWFYDLRIIVAKECGKAPHCYPTALARAGFKDFRTNTFLGNMVFGVNLPPYIKEVAVKCGETIGRDSKAWLIAFDAMIDVGENKIADDEPIKAEFEKLESPFNAVKKIKRKGTKKRDFLNWNKKLEEAFQNYKNQEAYDNIKRIIEESVERNKHNILFHEANACPEFWEQTRLVAGINLAVPLLRCAQSVIDSDYGG
ncbi:MAG: Alpha-aminoadipate--LysW ligase LysX [Candidatus Bathyarchaeota archaeon BA2]|nr:MAG: Alpha-aminoadipate--LysW ligase LysX [Candidatus Bathyarchaeota archaeon BA2]